MKRKTLVAAAIATVALLTLLLALPLFVAPAPATAISLPVTAASSQAINNQAVNNNPSEKQLQALQNPWEYFFNMTGFSFSSNSSGVFTYPFLPNTKFGMGFAKLVEFNDSNGDGFYNFNGSDQPIKEYDLVADVLWNKFNFSIDWPEGQWFPNGLRANLTGHEKIDTNFTISLIATLYIIPKTIEFNNTQVRIPAGLSLKFGLHILDYNWSDESLPDYPFSSRYLALVISLNSSVGDSASYNFKLSNGTVLSADISGAVPSLFGSHGNICEVFIVDALGIAHAKFSWFNGAYNTSVGLTMGKANSYFNKTGNTTNISMAFAHNDFTTGDIILDPYFQLIPPNYLPLFLPIFALAIMAMGVAGQAVSRLLLYGGIAALVVIGIIVVAVIASRRR